MRAFLARRDCEGRASQRLRQAKEWVDGQSSTKIVYWEDLKIADADRKENAATALQAAYRGWIGRQIAADRHGDTTDMRETLQLARVEAATCIQRRHRGVLGRRRASEERWRQLQVVPSAYSLKLLMRRSREIRRADGWVEFLDPDTSSFWYLEESTKHSTWNPPSAFADSMVCVWDPWPVPYSSPLDKPCRKAFSNMAEYQSHRLHAHPWQCAACGQRNSSICFPRCELCDNTIGPDGQDLEKVVGEAVRAALRNMRNPHLKRAEARDEIAPDGDPDRLSEGEYEVTDQSIKTLSGEWTDQDGKTDNRDADSCKQPRHGVEAHRRSRGKGTDVIQEVDPPSAGGFGDRMKMPSRRNDATTGVVDGFFQGGGGQGVSLGDASTGTASTGPDTSLRVCYRFTEGRCTQSTCSQAHPGIRDDARLERLETKGSRGLFNVRVCPVALAAALAGGDPCPVGRACKMYHPYVRPSTEEIVARLYPRRNGDRIKVYPSGATLKGRVVNEVFQGYGVYTWPNGDVFMGQWERGVRHGGGIFRSADGREYVGAWEANVREGYGVLTHPNGECYEGQFHRGKIHGVGFLSSASGDTFQGEFKKGKPDGIGCFRRKNGDKYNGHIHSGQAHGMGVLAYAAGEKYKGDFKADMRSGRGVCRYPDGSKFAGHWDRNVHEGFGVFVSATGRERYVGQWQSGKTHGYGRYIFANGDIYDGDFQEGQARGQGVYRYARSGGRAGNCYVGGWEADCRHGKGILRWTNGSKYEGYWKDGAIEGKGVFDYANGDRYRGEFKASRQDGRGVYTWRNKNSYTGKFSKGVIAGFGEMKYEAVGHHYRGAWKDNRKHGVGTFRYSDGNIYVGDFYEDEIHGKGRLTIAPDSILEEVYEGEFVKGVKHGRGIYVYRKGDGLVYDGDWEDGLRHGEGLLRFQDGSFYMGDFHREKKHGVGSMLWADGSQYQGKWVKNRRHGEGTLLHKDGSIFRGQFFEDKKNGTGTVTALDGSCYEGMWELDRVLGTKGRYTLLTGPAHEDKVHLRVFGY